MKRVLIDTHAIIWHYQASPQLSGRAAEAIFDPSSKPQVSVASIWEMAIKVRLGKLELHAESLDQFVADLHRDDILLLPVLAPEACDVATLPIDDHRDPFDRLIAAQCLRYGLRLVSSDAAFDRYGVERVW